MSRRSHCELLLEALADGKPHTHHELYALGIMVHSRVADLRRRGCEIVQWCARDLDGRRVYCYQLLGGAVFEREPGIGQLSLVP